MFLLNVSDTTLMMAMKKLSFEGNQLCYVKQALLNFPLNLFCSINYGFPLLFLCQGKQCGAK